MRYILFGLIALAIIAFAITVKTNEPNKSKKGIFSTLADWVGFSRMHKRQNTRLQNLFERNRNQHADSQERMRDQRQDTERILESQKTEQLFATRHNQSEWMSTLESEHSRSMEELRNQQDFLERSRIQQQGLHNMVSDLVSQGKFDPLRLKEVLEALDKQNQLLVDRGRQLMEVYQQEGQQRRISMDQMELRNIDTRIQQQNFSSQFNQAMERRNRIVDQFMQTAHDITMGGQNILEVIRPLNNQQVYDTAQKIFDSSRENERHLAQLREQTQQQTVQIKERMKELAEYNMQRHIDQQRDLEDRNRVARERTQDQIEQIKERAELAHRP